jgi:Zn finger protein HypA/HybF involved in hydrogenase expression
MYCPDCGYKVDDHAVFCPRCRHHFPEIVESDPREIPAGDPLFEEAAAGFPAKKIRMHCSVCGHEVDDQAVFCPRCGHHFPENVEPDPREVSAGDPLFEQEVMGFSAKELRHLEVELLQPSLFLVLVVSAGLYFFIPPLQVFTFSMSGLTITPGAGLALLIGLAGGLLFFYTARHSLRKFRSR